MEEIKTEEVQPVGLNFYTDVKWDLITYNKIPKEQFLKLRAKHTKAYATFLGAQGQLSFFMFKPLSWPEYVNVMSGQLGKYDTHDYIVKSCLLWPMIDDSNIHTLDAGTVLTLVYQILAQSSFLKDPSQALKMIVEIDD